MNTSSAIENSTAMVIPCAYSAYTYFTICTGSHLPDYERTHSQAPGLILITASACLHLPYACTVQDAGLQPPAALNRVSLQVLAVQQKEDRLQKQAKELQAERDQVPHLPVICSPTSISIPCGSVPLAWKVGGLAALLE